MHKRSIAFVLASGLLLAPAMLVLAQMGGGMMNGMMGGSALRHQYVMMNGIGPQYVRMRNPLAMSNANLAAGKSLFENNCSSCHGVSGRGDGPAAKALNPVPADLATAVRMPMARDSYLYWAIAEGGAPVRSAMPSFKLSLSSAQIWKIVLYLRTL
jgi:mono/diheme cytochrome c family protein